MILQFDKLDDMKELAKYLAGVLIKLGYNDRAKIVYEFSYNSYTTSTEYLGEFKILLEDLIKENVFHEDKIKAEISVAVKAINKAFNY